MAIYLDNAATTPLAPEVAEVMVSCMNENFGNPSSTHSLGRKAKAQLELARKTIAKILNCSAAEIIFTSCGTEADNVAILSSCKDLGIKRIITSPLEHHAVLHTIEVAQQEFGIEVEYLQHKQDGSFGLDQLEEILKDEKPTLISIMHANNEIGNINPVKEISKLAKQYNAYFHSDTVQTVGHYNIDLSDWKVDFIAGSAHKFHGPKGVGFLFKRKNIGIKTWQFGGSQEKGFRAGTENIASCLGMAKALELATLNLEEDQNKILQLKLELVEQLKSSVPGISFNGLSASSDANISNYSVLNLLIPQEDPQNMFLFQLDMAGFCVSGGSACQSGALGGSHVLNAINPPSDNPSIRISLSRFNTKEEVEKFGDFIANKN